MSTALTICGPYGQKLYASPRSQPNKYRRRPQLPRDPKLQISQYDHAELVTLSAQLVSRIPTLRAAVRQKSEWAFAGDSWQPIYYGENEAWGDKATDWLTHQVFPNAIRGNVRKDLIKGLQVSGMGWDIHGDDLAIFSSANGLPQMTIIPGTRIGNGEQKEGWWSNNVQGCGVTTPAGYGICQGGAFDGYKIYNGIIFDDSDEPIAARVLGWKKDGNDFVPTYADVMLGFAHGTHLASEYEWHGMGRPLPRIATSVLPWMDKEETDDLFRKGIKNAATKNVIHKLGEGQDSVDAMGNKASAVAIPASASASGTDETIWVEHVEGGDTTYIGSNETLTGFMYEQPHNNVEEFAIRNIRECLNDFGWLYELTDLSSTGRAPTRLATELVNNSIWQKQNTGETRLSWFVKFAVAVGITGKQLPEPPAGAFDEPYKWTFGYPKEMSVDQGNDIKGMLDMLRYGLTSQRITSSKWGYVQKRIRKDRQQENRALIDDAADLADYAKKKGHELPFLKAVEFFYQPSANPTALPAQNSTGDSGGIGDKKPKAPKPPKNDDES